MLRSLKSLFRPEDGVIIDFKKDFPVLSESPPSLTDWTVEYTFRNSHAKYYTIGGYGAQMMSDYISRKSATQALTFWFE